MTKRLAIEQLRRRMAEGGIELEKFPRISEYLRGRDYGGMLPNPRLWLRRAPGAVAPVTVSPYCCNFTITEPTTMSNDYTGGSAPLNLQPQSLEEIIVGWVHGDRVRLRALSEVERLRAVHNDPLGFWWRERFLASIGRRWRGFLFDRPRLAAVYDWLRNWPNLSTWWTILRLRAALVVHSVLIALKIRR